MLLVKLSTDKDSRQELEEGMKAIEKIQFKASR
jgi:hypothetical protein